MKQKPKKNQDNPSGYLREDHHEELEEPLHPMISTSESEQDDVKEEDPSHPASPSPSRERPMATRTGKRGRGKNSILSQLDSDEGVSDVQALERDQLDGLRTIEDHEQFPQDEELALSGPQYVREKQRAEDEMVIDELIQGIPKNQGYYMLLYRELSPNNYELKERIDHFHTWTDMEWEIASLVRRNTERNPRKWGSGRYRIVFKREKGLRGPKYDPIDFIIDAGDGADDMQKIGTPDPMASTEAQLDHLSKLLGTVRGILPSPQDPAQVQNQIANAFTQGMQLKVGENNQNNQAMSQMQLMMMTMMSEMIKTLRQPTDVTPKEDPVKSFAATVHMLKDMGVLQPPAPPVKEKSLVESLAELRAVGLEPFKKDDTMAQVQQVKAIASLLQDFMGAGGGERPGIAEKLVDALVPAIPEILGNIKGLSDNYMMAQGHKSSMGQPLPLSQGSQPPARIPTTTPQHSASAEAREMIMGGIQGGHGSTSPTSQPSQPQGEEPNMLVKMFFNKFKNAVTIGDVTFFPELTRTMQMTAEGQQVIGGIINGSITLENVLILIQQWGGLDFQIPELREPLQHYVQMYITWIQREAAEQARRAQGGAAQAQQPHHASNGNGQPAKDPIIGKCASCREEYEYDTMEDYMDGENNCDATNRETGAQCGGAILVSVPQR